jgi:hypothetical protein
MWLWRCAKHQKRESERGNTRTVSEVTKCRAAGTGESPGRWNALSWLSEFPTACTRLAVRGWGWLVWTGPTKPGKGAVDCFSRAGGCYGRRYPPPAQVFFIRIAPLGRSPPDGQGHAGSNPGIGSSSKMRFKIDKIWNATRWHPLGTRPSRFLAPFRQKPFEFFCHHDLTMTGTPVRSSFQSISNFRALDQDQVGAAPAGTPVSTGSGSHFRRAGMGSPHREIPPGGSLPFLGSPDNRISLAMRLREALAATRSSSLSLHRAATA